MSSSFYQLTKFKDTSISEEDNEFDDNDEVRHNNFNDNNEDFVEFKNEVKEWLLLDDDIITLQNAIKERKKKKDQLTPKILDYMNRYEINDLNTNNGKLKFTKSLQMKPLNKQFLISRLGDFFKDLGKGEKAATFILENRDKEEKMKLRRVITKKEINI